MTDLAEIRTFPQLIKYLREELDWPIATENFEELTFEYTPEELGIDSTSAAKIQEIKRLRPLSPHQPWGIFFVKFEPKKLPVVALRRILSRVALKKRASSNSSDRVAWAADDLLFVSNFGEGDRRQISFAHFSQDSSKHDIPILKVLGWNNLDTVLHLDGVAAELATKLSWPRDESDADRWREQWRSAFTLRPDEVIETSKALAAALAELARAIRDRTKTVLAIETDEGLITKLMKAFREALVHDLNADGFADMYAQTIAYGLLSARITDPEADSADGLATQLPVTNPFLKELMETFLQVGGRKDADRGPRIDFDELGVSEVVDLLDHANIDAVVRDFGDKNPQEDPVIHFYELFLKEYDAKQKASRGVFYTPRPVVSYIVRSVHELLQTELGLADGLADIATWGELATRHANLTVPEGLKPTDRFVTILDPATGTGTFLVEVIEVVHRTLVEKWKREGYGEKQILDLWNDYVPLHLLPRLHGFELLMAPYAIAHMKIGLKLHETGYRFASNERARIFLTNTLEPAQDSSGRLDFAVPALAREAAAVNIAKRQQHFTVVVGNPPYSALSANLSPENRRIVDRYRTVDGEPIRERSMLVFERNLQDDYIKFVSVAQSAIELSGCGIIGLVSNHSYLDGPTLRGMRQSLVKSFSRLLLLDLHGNLNKRERAPAGGVDINVFDIRQGVAIAFLIQSPLSSTPEQCMFGELWGTRIEKYSALLRQTAATTQFTNFVPTSPHYRFELIDLALSLEYQSFVALPEVLSKYLSGTSTGFDQLLVDFDRDDLLTKVARFSSAELPISHEGVELSIARGHAANLFASRASLTGSGWEQYARPFQQFPFDVRWAFLKREALQSHSIDVMEALSPTSPGLVATRQTKEGFGVFVSATYCGHKLLGSYDRSSVFAMRSVGLVDVSNVDHGPFRKAMQLGEAQPLSDREILEYVYACLYSPTYRSRYADPLSTDFPRFPIAASLELFRELARIGAELIDLHLVQTPEQRAIAARYDEVSRAWRYALPEGPNLPITLLFTGPATPVVGKVSWFDDTVWVNAIKPRKGVGDIKVTGTASFDGVPEEVWNFHIGGYQVCEKWLKDRRGRALTADDVAHYHRIVIALHETIRLMREIDEVIDSLGGWPRAFAST